MMTPPGLPQPKKPGIPKWVWALTIGGVLFILLVYAGIFWGYSKISQFAKSEFDKQNPQFEMLYIAKDGRLKVRHKPTGKELLVTPGAGNRLALRGLTTNPMIPAPAWLQLKDAAADEARPHRWTRAGDTGMLQEALEDLFTDQDFRIEKQDLTSLTACSAKLLHCVDLSFGLVEDAENRSYYDASYFSAP